MIPYDFPLVKDLRAVMMSEGENIIDSPSIELILSVTNYF